jgi:hypothetical protein
MTPRDGAPHQVLVEALDVVNARLAAARLQKEQQAAERAAEAAASAERRAAVDELDSLLMERTPTAAKNASAPMPSSASSSSLAAAGSAPAAAASAGAGAGAEATAPPAATSGVRPPLVVTPSSEGEAQPLPRAARARAMRPTLETARLLPPIALRAMYTALEASFGADATYRNDDKFKSADAQLRQGVCHLLRKEYQKAYV